MHNKWTNSIVAACIFSILCFTPAIAEDQAGAGAVSATYSNEELKSFIMANAELYQLQQQAFTQLQGIDSDQQKQEVLETANQQMLLVLQQVGLTADEYNAMGQTIQSDVQLQERVQTIASDLYKQPGQQ